jgi:hypothetical protein
MTVLAALAGASLACDLAVGGPTPPGPAIPVSTEAAGELQQIWKTALESSSNGEVGVTITEEQLTSFLAYKLAAQANPPLRDPQVYLRDGKIYIYGTARAGNISTTALMAVALVVNNDGSFKFSIDEADFGPLPVPDKLLASVSAGLNEAFTGQFGSLASGFKVTNAAIADGQMIILGTVTR